MNNRLTADEQAAGYKLLFDGSTLNGWACTASPDGWGVEDGSIVCYGKKARYLYTKERFDNFRLFAEFRTDPGVNSGLFFRVSDLSDLIHNGFEMQILDTCGEPVLGKQSCGAVYDLLEPAMNAAKPAGEWNSCMIECNENQIRIVLNDKRIIDMDINLWDTKFMNPDGTPNKFRKVLKNLPHTGRICIQDHGGRAWFRNLKLLPIGGQAHGHGHVPAEG